VFIERRFWRKDLSFTLLLSTVMVSLYVTVYGLHLVKKLGGIIATAIYSSFGTFLLHQFTLLMIPPGGSPLVVLGVFAPSCSRGDFLWLNSVLADPETKRPLG